MIMVGAVIALLIILYNTIFKAEIHILAVAVGIYLPIELSIPILIGGLIASKVKNKNKGILIGSGIITGEALMGIFIALPIFISGNKILILHLLISCKNRHILSVLSISKFSEAIVKATKKEPLIPDTLKNIYEKKEKITILNNNLNDIKEYILSKI